MERRTLVAVAGGITLTAAATLIALGLNFGLLRQATPTSGPGTFEPVAATGSGPTVSSIVTTSTVVARQAPDDDDQPEASQPEASHPGASQPEPDQHERHERGHDDDD